MHRRKHRRTSKRGSKNFINKTFEKSLAVANTTSKKYMPKVKSGLENIGSKVVKTGSRSVPFLQKMTRKLFGMFSGTKRRRRH